MTFPSFAISTSIVITLDLYEPYTVNNTVPVLSVPTDILGNIFYHKMIKKSGEHKRYSTTIHQY